MRGHSPRAQAPSIDNPGSHLSSRRARHRQRASRPRRIAKGIGIGVVVLVMVLSTAFVVIYRHLQGNIEEIPFAEGSRPTAIKAEGPKQPVNVLVMGSDTREGENGKGIGGSTPGLSDTTILLHLSANRKFAYGVSLPRDAMVEQPECERKNGNGTDPGGLRMFNAAYAIGGAPCTVKMVEHLTGIRINHFVVVDFVGFKNMVNAIDGVTICVPEEVNDTIGHIKLPAGTYKVTGQQALDYVRVRHDIGAPTGDIGRMKRQQTFISAMIEKVVSAGTLANPIRLYNFLDAATDSLKTDPGLKNLKLMASLGSSLKDIGLDRVKFITVPWQPDPNDSNRVVWAPEAETVWNKIKHDKPLGAQLVSEAVTPGSEASAAVSPSAGASGGPSAGTSGSPSSSPSASPSQTEEQKKAAARAAGLCT